MAKANRAIEEYEMKIVRKVRKISKVRKIRKKKVYVPRTKEDVGTSKAEYEFGLFLKRLGIEIEEQFQIAYKLSINSIFKSKILNEFNWWHL